MLRSHKPACCKLALNVSANRVPLDLNQSILLSLIANELLLNALKHAFPDGRQGVVRVVLARATNGHVTLSVQDDGVGLPAGFNLRELQSMGLPIVSTLAQPLKGALKVKVVSGATFQLTFDEASG